MVGGKNQYMFWCEKIKWNSNTIYLSINKANIVPSNNPDYYKGKIEVIIEKNMISGQINNAKLNIENESYNVDSNIIDSLINIVENNILNI